MKAVGCRIRIRCYAFYLYVCTLHESWLHEQQKARACNRQTFDQTHRDKARKAREKDCFIKQHHSIFKFALSEWRLAT